MPQRTAQSIKRDREVKEYYLAGGTRSGAMEKFNLKSNQISSLSGRINIHWSLSLKERREYAETGVKPERKKEFVLRTPRARPHSNPPPGKVIAARDKKAPERTMPTRLAPDEVPVRRVNYGKSTRLTEHEKYVRGIVEKDEAERRSGGGSAFPEPTEEVPADIIRYLKEHCYG